MLFRLVAVVAATVLLASTALAEKAAPEPASPSAVAVYDLKDKEPVSPARQRQLKCGAEWRSLSAADKTAKGPTWAQFYSKCVKRLKLPAE